MLTHILLSDTIIFLLTINHSSTRQPLLLRILSLLRHNPNFFGFDILFVSALLALSFSSRLARPVTVRISQSRLACVRARDVKKDIASFHNWQSLRTLFLSLHLPCPFRLAWHDLSPRGFNNPGWLA
jgi:hypothetical protein